MRIELERRLHERNCFITLTYSDEHLPSDYSLDKSHLTKFFKRLRKQRGSFRYYACGEYGDQTQRAHYHACLFGMDFSDKQHFRRIGTNHLYTSEELNRIWGYGHCSVGSLTFESAAYCARYVMKKKIGLTNKATSHVRLDEQTGELIPLVQPYAVMSLQTAIGKAWLEKHHSDIYGANKDFLVLKGKKLKPAKYFDRIYDAINPKHMEEIKTQRKDKFEPMTDQELRAHAKITRARIIQRTQV